MIEVRGYLSELEDKCQVDYSSAGLKELAETMGRIAAYRSRVARLMTKAVIREAEAEALHQKAGYALLEVKAVATESDSVQSISRPDLRRERVNILTLPFVKFRAQMTGRLGRHISQREALKVALKELDSLQSSLSRQLAAIQVDLHISH